MNSIYSVNMIFKFCFGIIDINEEKDTFLETPWYFNVDNWENYCYYISSEERAKVKRPSKKILHYREWNKLGGNSDDE